MANWHVGFTAFGGPAVQFQTVRLHTFRTFATRVADVPIVSRKICEEIGMDRRTIGTHVSRTMRNLLIGFQYQQIFAISQALPGSASTKMLFCINTIHSGFTAGVLAFLLFW